VKGRWGAIAVHASVATTVDAVSSIGHTSKAVDAGGEEASCTAQMATDALPRCIMAPRKRVSSSARR